MKYTPKAGQVVDLYRAYTESICSRCKKPLEWTPLIYGVSEEVDTDHSGTEFADVEVYYQAHCCGVTVTLAPARVMVQVREEELE